MNETAMPILALRARRSTLLRIAALTLGLLAAVPGQAGVPAPYAAMVIEPRGLPDRAEFDLTPAVERARASVKPHWHSSNCVTRIAFPRKT